MIDFLQWWYTDNRGNTFMSLWHCALEYLPVVIAITLFRFGIVFQYADITIKDFKNYRKYPASKLSKYFLGKTKVFVFCLMAGYGYGILSTWFNPYWLLVLLLLVLNIVTYRFRLIHRDLEPFTEIYYLEQKVKGYKAEINKISKSIIIDLFTGTGKIKMIPYSELDKIELNKPFDSDGSGVIRNTRIEIGVPCFSSTSIMKANSYVEPHQHDTDKILKCVKGAFYDNNTDRWYNPGEYLIIKKAVGDNDKDNWHDIKTGALETHLQTFIFPDK
jgi:hypothetical protein